MACPRYIPYGSIVAAILVYCGIGLFCGASLTAFSHTESMFNDHTRIDESKVISALRIIVYVVTGFMVVVALLYIILGYAATKQSKVQVYDDREVMCGGMPCISVVLYVAYLVTLIWLVIGGACSIPVIFTYMVHKYASTVDITVSTCMDLKMYGFVNLPDSTKNTTICGTQLQGFGKLAREAMIMYTILLGGCLLVILGMIHFLMCLSANWGHVKDGLKRRDYESRRRQEEEELQEMSGGSGARGLRAKIYDTNMSQVAYNPQLPPIGGFGEQHRHSSQPTMSTERLVNDYY